MRSNAYEQRVHRVMDHIRRNLGDDLSLPALAKIAHFSPYHFHRIFKGVAHETLAAFTRRARLERAVYLMRGSPNRELSSIAMEVGFGAPADLSRLFRRYYGCAPSQWDRHSRLDGQVDLAREAREQAMSEPAPEVRIVEHAACRLAYVRVRDPWQGPHLADGYRRLVTWLEGEGIDWRCSQLVGMSWDNDLATPLDQLTYDLGLTLEAEPTPTPTDGFGIRQLPSVRAVQIHCTSLRETAMAWEYLYRRWLPQSPDEPEDVPALKRFRVVPEQLDEHAWDVDCSIAIRRRLP